MGRSPGEAHKVKDNVLFVCLDSLRYDTFMAASKPNMDRIGEARLVHSLACTTIPSIVGYLMNFPPIGLGGPERLYLFKYCGRYEWAPLFHKRQDFETALITGNALITRLDSRLNGGLRSGFDHIIWKIPLRGGSEEAAREIDEILVSGKPPFFVFTLLMETHEVYIDGTEKYLINDKDDPKKSFEYQSRAVEFVDSIFPQLLEPFERLGNGTTVMITSDHGEFFGPDFFGHDPTWELQFHSKLFEIPFLEGVI